MRDGVGSRQAEAWAMASRKLYGKAGFEFFDHTGWICGKFQMPEDLPDHLALRNGGDDPQRPLLRIGKT